MVAQFPAEELRRLGMREGRELDSEGPALRVSRVTLTGEIDLSRAEQVEAELAAAEATSPEVLQIDLSSVSFMDSQGLKLLLGAHSRAQTNGRRVLILGP